MCTVSTQLLTEASRGDEAAAKRLTPLVYDELRALAHRYMGHHGSGGALTLQPTALVHEAFLRLVDQSVADYKSRTHFYAVAALAMRHVLIDHLRGRNRAKRGGEWQRVTITNAADPAQGDEIDLLALNEALAKLAELDERAARVVDLRFFGGLTEAEVAGVLDVSERTVRNDWSMARAWLRCALEGGGAQEG